MAGALIDVEIDDREVLQGLSELLARGRNLAPAMAAIGEYLDLAHRQRWDRGVAPDGAPWQPLKPQTIARKKRNADKILVLDAHLRDTLRYQADSTSVEFGTDRIYGATHQFGRDAIPARPFLGLSADDETEVLAILQDYIAGG